MKVSKQSVLVLALLAVCDAGHADLSKSVEYEVLDECVGQLKRYKGSKIKLCGCAMEKTVENGWWPDYDDDDLKEDHEKFWRELDKNLDICLMKMLLGEKLF